MKHSYKVKGVEIGFLNKQQRSTMRIHSVHHTKKHLKKMADLMKSGSSFEQAHIKSQREVGS